MSRVFAPLEASHPLVGTECPACKVAFIPGDRVTLVALGPGDDIEEQAKASAGRAYIAVAAPIHAACGGMQ